MNIPEKSIKRIKSYAKQIGRTEKELKSLYEKIYQKDELDYPKYNSNTHHGRAIIELRRTLIEEEGLDRSTAILFRGFFFADTDVIDFVDIMKNKAKSWYNNPILKPRALRTHMVTKDGTPLDTRKIVDFQENTNYLQPFGEDDHSFFRALFGIAGEGKEMKNAKLIKLNNNSPMDIEMTYMPWQLYDFRATIRKKKKASNSNILELNATSVTKFKPSDVSLDSEAKVDLVRKNKVWLLEDLETVWDMSGKDKSERRSTLRQSPILIEANVVNIYAKVSVKGKSRTLRLDDAESEKLASKKYTCFLAQYIPIEFGENSRVILLGSLDKLKNRNNNNEEELIINSMGYIVVPGYAWRKD